MIPILIGCECSGAVRRAFRAKGFDAWSCDLKPAEDGDPHHITGDLRQAIKARPWAALICFPDCTYLCTSGLHWIARGRIEKDGRARAVHHAEALAFVRFLLGADVPHIALENPVGAIGSKIREAQQSIQPYQYGHDASKRTCLWLKNLPPLVGTRYILPRAVCQNEKCGAVEMGACELVERALARGCIECGSKCLPRWANQTDSGQNKLSPSKKRAADRARTYSGIAQAMADQWAPAILSQN